MKSRAQAASAFSGSAYWIALVAVVIVFGLSSTMLKAESAGTFYKRGQSAEAKEDYDTAADNYQKANAKAPKDLQFRAAYYRIRITASAVHVTKGRKLMEAGDDQAALAEFLHATAIDPSNEAALQSIASVRKKNGEATQGGDTSLSQTEGKQEDLDSMGSPALLKPVSNEPLTLHMQEDAKVVYQAVGKASGVNVLFDPDYQSKRIQVDLNGVSLVDALRIVGTISNTFWKPVTENTIFVAANTRAKRTELDEQAVQTFYLSNAWQQTDLTDVQTAIRNVLTNVKAYGVASQNAIVVRGTPDELLLVQKLINDLDKARAEVVVDIAVMEVSKNWQRTLGLAWPSSVGVSLQGTSSSSSSSSSSGSSTTTTSTPTLYQLSHLKASNFAVTVGSATANLLLSDSNTKILQNPRLRSTDQQKATFKVGSKIPTATGSYSSGNSTSSANSLVNTQFQYIDVGVNVEMTPTIHFDHDVTLKIKIEVSSHSGDTTISGVTEPIISQRVIDQVIRLREGEASILGGIQDKQDKISWSGIPGLSSIPGLKYLFGSKDHNITDDELVFLVVPHVVRSQSLDETNLRTVDTGSGQNSIELRHVPVDLPKLNPTPKLNTNPGLDAAPGPASPERTKKRDRSSLGTVPGQTANAAVPAALAQMHQAAETIGSAAATSLPADSSAPGANAAKASFSFVPLPGPVAAGATFRLPVLLSGAADVATIPLQIQYDPAKISLVNVDSGDFLSKDGQAVALVHRDDGPGDIKITSSRPPGASGVSGAGVVCILTFQAKATGESAVVITRPGAINSAQKQLPAQGARLSIQVK